MYSYEECVRAVNLYIKLAQRISATIIQLGYPTKNALKARYRKYEPRQDVSTLGRSEGDSLETKAEPVRPALGQHFGHQLRYACHNGFELHIVTIHRNCDEKTRSSRRFLCWTDKARCSCHAPRSTQGCSRHALGRLCISACPLSSVSLIAM